MTEEERRRIYEKIEAWHEDQTDKRPLHEVLGMTLLEYAEFVIGNYEDDMSTIETVEMQVRKLLNAAKAEGTILIKNCESIKDQNGAVVGRCMLCVAGGTDDEDTYVVQAALALGITADKAGMLLDGWDGRLSEYYAHNPWWDLGKRLAKEFQPVLDEDLRRALSEA